MSKGAFIYALIISALFSSPGCKKSDKAEIFHSELESIADISAAFLISYCAGDYAESYNKFGYRFKKQWFESVLKMNYEDFIQSPNFEIPPGFLLDHLENHTAEDFQVDLFSEIMNLAANQKALPISCDNFSDWRIVESEVDEKNTALIKYQFQELVTLFRLKKGQKGQFKIEQITQFKTSSEVVNFPRN